MKRKMKEKKNENQRKIQESERISKVKYSLVLPTIRNRVAYLIISDLKFRDIDLVYTRYWVASLYYACPSSK